MVIWVAQGKCMFVMQKLCLICFQSTVGEQYPKNLPTLLHFLILPKWDVEFVVFEVLLHVFLVDMFNSDKNSRMSKL